MTQILVYLTLVLSLAVISYANGNYGYGQYSNAQCNRDVYIRAQNQIRLDMSRNLQPGQYEPNYSGMSNAYQGNTQMDNQCR